MPRLSVYRPTGLQEGWNEPIDYCGRCYPSLERAMQTWRVPAWMVDMDTEHPDYRLDQYVCETCGRALGAIDN